MHYINISNINKQKLMHSVEQKQYTISQYLFALCTVITIKNLITRIILLQSVSFSQQLGKLSALRSVREM